MTSVQKKTKDGPPGYQTRLGQCLCVDCLTGLNDLEDESIDLVLASPPSILQKSGSRLSESEEEYMNWLFQAGKAVFSKLKEEGSFVLNLPGWFNSDEPSFSLYQYKLLVSLCDEIGFELAQPMHWYNTKAFPGPNRWIRKGKIRAASSVNTIWWFCKSARKCKANVSNVLVPYSDRMKKFLKNPSQFVESDQTKRPSGYVHNQSAWAKDNGGAIPSNCLKFPNVETDGNYLKFCRKLSVKPSPFDIPAALPEFFIKFLTDEGDLVVDLFSGSNTTGKAAESLNRKWISYEPSKEAAAASSLRLAKDSKSAAECYKSILKGESVVLNRT